MRRLAAGIESFDARLITVRGAIERLLQSWKDNHAVRFRRDILDVSTTHTKAVLRALLEADARLNRSAQVFRSLGEEIDDR